MGPRPGLTVTIKSHPGWMQHIFPIHRQCMLRPYRARSFCVFAPGRCPGLVYPPLSGSNKSYAHNLNCSVWTKIMSAIKIMIKILKTKSL